MYSSNQYLVRPTMCQGTNDKDTLGTKTDMISALMRGQNRHLNRCQNWRWVQLVGREGERRSLHNSKRACSLNCSKYHEGEVKRVIRAKNNTLMVRKVLWGSDLGDKT